MNPTDILKAILYLLSLVAVSAIGASIGWRIPWDKIIETWHKVRIQSTGNSGRDALETGG